MKLKKHIKNYWFFYVLGLVIVLSIVIIAALDYKLGFVDNMWWRFQK